MFDLIGETLRRLRKEGGKTLEQIGKEARLGRGQLSRIETGQQQATFKTLGKILKSQHLSRREFFRRYELVETERQAARGLGAGSDGADLEGASYTRSVSSAWPSEVREALSRVESFITTAFNPDRPLAQGAIELGDLLILFRVVPKSALPPVAGEPGGPVAGPEAPTPPAPPAAPRPARSGRGRRGKKR